MYNLEKSLRDRRNRLEKQNPSFSSTLLDKIYRSIDEGEPNGGETTTVKKQSRGAEEEESPSLREACLLDKWMDQNAKEKISLRRRNHFSSELDKKYAMLDHDYDHHDALFFSSGSNSSDSSSGGLSSSDTESFYISKPSRSCFARPKPIRVRSEKAEVHKDRHYNSATDQHTPKLKSRVLRMYGNLKNLKQPISPGGRLASFVNSIFTGNAKKSNNPSSTQRVSRSTCSSASSFSRSCLSKNSPASSQKLCNVDKRSAQFRPVSVISDKDLRPREHKSLYREREELKQMSVPVPSSKKEDTGLKLQTMEKNSYKEDEHEEEDDDDDDASCASSDLFELDHLAVIGEKYRDELPVYETTRVDRNRVISNSLYV